jgi:penicillin-binding protein 2
MRRGAWATSRARSSRWTWNGDILAFVSMPAFDPNSFSDGIGRTEWRMLSEDDHIPLLNKVTQGLYPSGSTIKPAMALAFLKQGIDPKRRVHCPGGYQIGNRYFRCDAVHGSMDMHTAIERSCNTYFWATGLITDPEQTTRWSISGLWREIRPADPDPALRHDAQSEMAGEEI